VTFPGELNLWAEQGRCSRKAEARAPLAPICAGTTAAYLAEAPHRSTQSSMETRRRVGQIRAQRSRVRPASPGFRDIGFFGALPPGHLTSQSRRPTTAPAATSRDHKHRALAPWGTALESIKASGLRWRNVGAVRPALGRALANAALEGALSSKQTFTQAEWDAFGIEDLRPDDWIQSGSLYFKPTFMQRPPLLDVSMLAEHQNKHIFMSVLALGTHGKEELRQLLDEGRVLLSALPNGLAAEICAAASENRHRNPIASLLCDSLRPAGERNVCRDTQKPEEDRAHLQEGLSLLVTHGAQLLEKIQETMVRTPCECINVCFCLIGDEVVLRMFGCSTVVHECIKCDERI